MLRLTTGLLLSLMLVLASPSEADSDRRISHLLLETERGGILIELNTRRAPLTVAAILERAEAGHYDGVIFHRVIEGFVAQTGGYTPDFSAREGGEAVPNESGNGLRNRRGSVGLARGEEPHSGKAQFYINLADNERLDPSSRRWGYAVFGRVTAGMSLLDAIADIPTAGRGPFSSDVPEEDVIIERARPLDRDEALAWIVAREEAQMEEGNQE